MWIPSTQQEKSATRMNDQDDLEEFLHQYFLGELDLSLTLNFQLQSHTISRFWFILTGEEN